MSVLIRCRGRACAGSTLCTLTRTLGPVTGVVGTQVVCHSLLHCGGKMYSYSSSGEDTGTQELHPSKKCRKLGDKTDAKTSNDKRRRSKRFTTAENAALVDGVIQHYNQLFGRSHVTTGGKEAIWQRIADSVNAVGVCRRRGDVCKKRFNDCKGTVKKKLSLIQHPVRGSGPSVRIELLEWEKKLRDHFSPEAVTGVSSGLDTGAESTLRRFGTEDISESKHRLQLFVPSQNKSPRTDPQWPQFTRASVATDIQNKGIYVDDFPKFSKCVQFLESAQENAQQSHPTVSSGGKRKRKEKHLLSGTLAAFQEYPVLNSIGYTDVPIRLGQKQPWSETPIEDKLHPVFQVQGIPETMTISNSVEHDYTLSMAKTPEEEEAHRDNGEDNEVLSACHYTSDELSDHSEDRPIVENDAFCPNQVLPPEQEDTISSSSSIHMKVVAREPEQTETFTIGDPNAVPTMELVDNLFNSTLHQFRNLIKEEVGGIRNELRDLRLSVEDLSHAHVQNQRNIATSFLVMAESIKAMSQSHKEMLLFQKQILGVLRCTEQPQTSESPTEDDENELSSVAAGSASAHASPPVTPEKSPRTKRSIKPPQRFKEH
ncbi:uncharacterized protein LOC134983963 isoform X2 [Pseudophryne corroboree]|uniref:uncharacterized protein LOC134983963 isoform X2 n=1 Tax=Pseudophryne corroboree TaxID=495146 RepID=UPI003081FDB5